MVRFLITLVACTALILGVGCEDKASSTAAAGATQQKSGLRKPPAELPENPSEGLGMATRNEDGTSSGGK
ncbi:MAG: hypothetical protein KDA25_03655 [Phycisphaerales bacterium]|nr:hypothetical protein [Phycisphaerales bacterium]